MIFNSPDAKKVSNSWAICEAFLGSNEGWTLNQEENGTSQDMISSGDSCMNNKEAQTRSQGLLTLAMEETAAPAGC